MHDHAARSARASRATRRDRIERDEIARDSIDARVSLAHVRRMPALRIRSTRERCRTFAAQRTRRILCSTRSPRVEVE